MAFLELFSKSTLKHTKYKTPTQKMGVFQCPYKSKVSAILEEK